MTDPRIVVVEERKLVEGRVMCVRFTRRRHKIGVPGV